MAMEGALCPLSGAGRAVPARTSSSRRAMARTCAQGSAPSQLTSPRQPSTPLVPRPPVAARPLLPLAAGGPASGQGCRTRGVACRAVDKAYLELGARTLSGKALSAVPGCPSPLGPSPLEGGSGVNFALRAPAATSVTLCLFKEDGSALQEVPMESKDDKGVWHAAVQGLPLAGVLYGYKVDGKGGWETTYRWDISKVLLDPYAPLVKGRARYGVRDEWEQFKLKEGSRFLGTFDFTAAPFDWGVDYVRPGLAQKDLVIYEMPIRTFTASPSSGLEEGMRGTFAGMKAKVPYLKSLGINCVEVLPVFEWDELEFQRIKNPRDHMVNIWGYSHMSFMAIATRLGSDGRGPAAAAVEFKELVRELHNNGIEVILDVVYNHTVEGGDDDPYLLSWRGIDNPSYYMCDKDQYVQLLNYSGCGNTVNANNDLTKDLILDSLRWWVNEYHVDGFRFDLASALCRDGKGNILTRPPLIAAIAKDPLLSKCKLLAEPWDCGAYMVGEFPNWDVWSEWNGKYRDDVRRFVRGDPGMKPAFATRLSGSADLYHKNNRKPSDSINFVIAHDGFTLYDLVSYNEKHNDDNGESNRDGCNDNFSWNCGVEGPTSDAEVQGLRLRQMKNLHLALMVSQGTPMVLAGDEYCQTRGGNNNYYGHDSPLTWFDWDKCKEQQKEDGFWNFYSGLIKFRLSCPLLLRDTFLGPQDITWHEDNWDNYESKFLAFTLHDRDGGFGDLYIAFNAHDYPIPVHLPEGKAWARIVDTNLQPGRDFTPDKKEALSPQYMVQPRTSVMMRAVQLP